MKKFSTTFINAILYSLLWTISCKENSATQQSVSEKIHIQNSDTVILSSGVYLISPNTIEIDSLKKTKGEENFYTIADDSNFYLSKILNNLKTPLKEIKQKNVNFKDDKFIFKKSAYQENWLIIEYNKGQKPQIYSLVDFNIKLDNKSEESAASFYSIKKYSGNNDFYSAKFDINGDGLQDVIYSSKAYKGDSLFIFFQEKNTYKLKLATINLSQDGGQVFSAIEKNGLGFNLQTDSPEGSDRYIYQISYRNNDFIVDHVSHKLESWQNQKSQNCEYSPRVSMKLDQKTLTDKLISAEDNAKCF